jgi:hypothetical protein
VDPARGCGRFGNEAGRAIVNLPRIKPMEGFLCPTLLRQSIQNFLRTSNFSDFVGGWNCDFGVDTAEKLFT